MYRRGALGIALAVLLAGCGLVAPTVSPGRSLVDAPASPARSSAVPAFAPADCPEEVTVVMVIVPTCGYLTVPERRDRPGARSIRVFVVRIDPPEGIVENDPMVVVGETLGGRLEYGGLAILAGRTGRIAYLVDRRGSGLSQPNLACPELAAAGSATLAYPATDYRATEPILAAVGDCRDRLLGEGIDLSAYGLDESAMDIETLRIALGVEQWNVIAFGSASRLALEVGRMAPAGVRTIVLDSPVLPQGPDPMFAANATSSAITKLGIACAADARCHAEHPDVEADLDRAMTSLDDRPIRLDLEPTNGGTVPLVVDGVRFGRAARDLLAADGGNEIGNLLTSVAGAIDRNLVPEDAIVQRMARDDGLCLGYVPNCADILYGSLLSTICRDILPFADRDTALVAGRTVAGMSRVFATNPYFAACEVWDIQPGDTAPAAPLQSDIPVLAMAGQFDPFTGPISDVQSASAGLSRAVFVEVPNQSYNIFGFNECPRQVRRGWLDHPGAALDTGCFNAMPGVRLSS